MLSFAFSDEDEDEEDTASVPIEKKVGVLMLIGLRLPQNCQLPVDV